MNFANLHPEGSVHVYPNIQTIAGSQALQDTFVYDINKSINSNLWLFYTERYA
jgi:hypothetical protein